LTGIHGKSYRLHTGYSRDGLANDILTGVMLPTSCH